MATSVTCVSNVCVCVCVCVCSTQWISDSLGMVTLVGSQIWWTWETEDVFRRVREGNKHAMKDFAAKLTTQLSELTNMVRDSHTHTHTHTRQARLLHAPAQARITPHMLVE